MELWAGFVGVEEDAKTHALMPKIGWLARIADEQAEEAARQKAESQGLKGTEDIEVKEWKGLPIPTREVTKSKKAKKSSKKTAKSNMNLYSSLSYKHRAKKEANARRRAEDLAKLPKEPVKRFFARLHPKRVFKWWFSWRGQKAILKFFAACILLLIIFIGGLFLYYKKDLDQIRLDEMNISETVNTYLDRNGEVLWKDTGNDNYRLVVDTEEIPDYMKWATIAIEDRNF